jgi:hypothetical protein
LENNVATTTLQLNANELTVLGNVSALAAEYPEDVRTTEGIASAAKKEGTMSSLLLLRY